MPDEKILHQDDVEEVIEDEFDDRTESNVAIDDLVAITGGQSPTEAEHNLVVSAVNDILQALRTYGVIPAE